MAVKQEAWGSRVGLILAIAGNAVGLGNFLRFPVQAVQNGGGAFIIPYLISFLIMGIPLLWVEWTIGRFGGARGHHSTPFIMHSMGKRALWKYVGVFGIFANIAIASYYCYIESWTLSYIYHSIVGTFNGMSQTQVSIFFDNYLNVMFSTTGIPYEAIIFFLFCLVLNTWILSRGLSGGIEIAAKIAVPLLIIFGIFLAIQAFTLKAGVNGAIFDGAVGFNFLWTPQFDSLGNPKVWLAAAGQIFFTLSVGMGSIQCYASYLKEKEDIALNSMSAGWMNEFVEVVLGSAIIIPISIGYFGIDKVIGLVENGGMGLAFRTLPFLFSQWGQLLGAFAGVAFFGLLFFAGITSSLAMGTPIMGFLRDEYGWKRKPAAYAFGVSILIFGLPTVLFLQQGVFDEYDYWGGTVSLVVFAMLEVILFSWVFGIEKGWKEINKGADIKIPVFYKYILKYVTPVMLIIVFLAALVRPAGDNWTKMGTDEWQFHEGSIIGQIMHLGSGPNKDYFADEFYSEVDGRVTNIDNSKHGYIEISKETDGEMQTVARYSIGTDDRLIVKKGDTVKTGQVLYHGSIINNIFFIDMSRLLLLLLFAVISYFVWYAYRKNKKTLDNL
jgi:SNF family Na+-dependent transporter